MFVYIHSKCSTCQDALKFLKDKNKDFTIKDIVKEPPTVEELHKMLNFMKGNIKKLLNTSGQLYREMGLSEKLKQMSVPEILALLSQNGMLIKRPFVLGAAFGLTGFNKDIWSEKI